MQTITTGQLSGLLNIPTASLMRYVRDYREMFTPSVQRNKRGRRWTPQDVELVMRIRELHQAHKGRDYIRQALAEGRPAATTPPAHDIYTALIETEQAAKATTENLHKAEKLMEHAAWRAPDYLYTINILRRRYDDMRHDYDILKFELFRLKWIFRHPRALPPKRRYEFNIWNKFRRWVEEETDKDLAKEQEARDAIERSRANYLRQHPEFEDDF